jgi:hypothetical protein
MYTHVNGTFLGNDTITDFNGGTIAIGKDKIGFDGTAGILEVGDFSTIGIDSTLTLNTAAAVASHGHAGGVITFDDDNIFNTAVPLTTTGDVAAVLQYLQANDIGDALDAVALVGVNINALELTAYSLQLTASVATAITITGAVTKQNKFDAFWMSVKLILLSERLINNE